MPSPQAAERFRESLFDVQDGKCWLCGGHMLFRRREERSDNNPWTATLDHIQARSNGGTWRRENLKLAHAVCNNMRADNEDITETCPVRLARQKARYRKRKARYPLGWVSVEVHPLRVTLMSLSEPDLIRPATPA